MKIIANSPVVLFNDMGEYLHVMYVFTPYILRGKGLMRELWQETILPELTKNLFLKIVPDLDTDPVRLRQFYESLGFEFNDDGVQGVLVVDEKS